MKKKFIAVLPYAVCCFFFIAYALLSLIRHFHFGSFGFDLGIIDQIVWKYSHVKAPITTIQFYPFTSLLTDHVEFIYILLSPFYWFYKSPNTLLFLQAFLIAFSGLPLYWLARKKQIGVFISSAILIAYLSFYGIQNAIWFDVHSSVFGVAFLAWFLYFFYANQKKRALLAFFLAILCKEDVAFITLLISIIYYWTTRKKIALFFIAASVGYLCAIFLVYFPYFTLDGYRYDNAGGLFADTNPYYLYDSPEKREVYFYSLGWFGFLPLLSPVFLIPALGDIARYFVLGNNIDGAHGLFMHYRASLALLLVWPFIMTIEKYKKLNNKYVGIALLVVVAALQYQLHVPLTYLTKAWFWYEPASVQDIKSVIKEIPDNASLVAQNNIVPHVAQRDEIFTLWPEQKKSMQWFRWAGKPHYLLVDTAGTWDIRHLLTNREDFMKGLKNLEENKYIKKKIQRGSVILYTIEK